MVAEQRFKANGDERYTLRYTFDESNSPIGFDIKYPNESTWAYYYFVKNVQGDVVAMYHWYEPGKAYLVCTYEYDPWGKLLSVKNSSGTALASTTYHVSNYNPFRYRSYYYDIDTELYYLQSRYYDPAIGRFINQDGLISTEQGLLGFNMFAYCGNNPVNSVDSAGLMHDDIFFGTVKKADRTQAAVLTAGAVNTAQPGKKTTTKTTPATNPITNAITSAHNFVTNTDEKVVLNAKFFAFYKGVPVVKLPMGDNAFSFGAMFIGNEVTDIQAVRHEYGHSVHFSQVWIRYLL